jgi:hypothetical protein
MAGSRGWDKWMGQYVGVVDESGGKAGVNVVVA